MMHVRIGVGPRAIRHRVMIDKSVTRDGSWIQTAIMNGRTACDETIAGKFYLAIDADYEGELCELGCFTQAEIKMAKKMKADAEAKILADAEQWERDRNEMNARALEARAEGRARLERFRTGETEPVPKSLPVDPIPTPDPDEEAP